VAARLRRLRQHAMDVSDLARHSARDIVFEGYPERGWNCRMTDMQAALGLRQLDALDGILAERSRLADRYNAAFGQIAQLETPYEPPYATRTWQSYAVRIRPGARMDRTELMRQLLHDGVATRRGVMAIHQEAAYPEALRIPLPHTERAAEDVLMLPLFPGLTDAQQDYVLEQVIDHVLPLAA
jgi:dTDP-4-amino-4,6-dideoxygalactose transaminase